MSTLQWPYAEGSMTGRWGPPTSNHNFCEEDYIITKYIAEFVNTLTNLVYVIYGLHGLRRVQTRQDGGVFSSLAFPYWGLIGVGVLSAWFHTTLKYHSQMGDDLSMFLAVGAVMHQVLIFNTTPSRRLQITLLILGIVGAVSVYHVWTDEIILHEITFAGMVFITGRRIRKLIRERVADDQAKAKLGRLATFGIGSGLFGYFLWNIDFHLCGYVTAAKRAVGLPWGFLLELHGWWHVFTGIGAYVGMALCEYLVTLDEKGNDGAGEGFVWPVRNVLRDVDGEAKARKER